MHARAASSACPLPWSPSRIESRVVINARPEAECAGRPGLGPARLAGIGIARPVRPVGYLVLLTGDPPGNAPDHVGRRSANSDLGHFILPLAGFGFEVRTPGRMATSALGASRQPPCSRMNWASSARSALRTVVLLLRFQPGPASPPGK